MPGAVPHPQGAGRRVRSLRERGWQAGAPRSAADSATRFRRGAVPRDRQGVERESDLGRGHVHHRDRRDHHLPGLQAGAVHRLLEARWRRRRYCRHRGHLQLLRAQAEDRHGSIPRPGAGGGARRRRADRTRDDGRIRLADALARRSSPSDRRLEERRQRHLRRDAAAGEQAARGNEDRRRCKRRRAGGRGAGRERRARGADACRLRLGDDRHLRQAMARARRRGDRGRRSHYRRPHRAPGRALPRHAAGGRAGSRTAIDARALFKVAEPGLGWGGTDITDPLAIIEKIDPRKAWPGMRLLMVSTTGEDAEWFVLDEKLAPVRQPMPGAIRTVVERIVENCEPALCTVLFMGGAGGSLRAGVTENPVRLTRSVKERITRVTCGGAPVYVWPGGGITLMVDVLRMPGRSFGYVPTPALVLPIEFTMSPDAYAAMGGHVGRVVPIERALREARVKAEAWSAENAWPG